MLDLELPADPLRRFVAGCRALEARRRWFDDGRLLRYAALPLVAGARGAAPEAAADRVADAADRLAESSSWLEGLKGSIRIPVAALLVAGGADPAAFAAEHRRIRARLRELGLRRGQPYEALAAAILHLGAAATDVDLQRFQQIYAAMRAEHWWLTGPDDYPACALLVVRHRRHDPDGTTARIVARTEHFYAYLRSLGLAAGDPLQMASHILYLADGSEAEVEARFTALHGGFRAAGVRMWQTDYDELAILSLLADPADRIVTTVVEHRRRLAAEFRFIGPVLDFSYACATAFLQHLAGSTRARPDLVRDLEVATLAMAANAAIIAGRPKG